MTCSDPNICLYYAVQGLLVGLLAGSILAKAYYKKKDHPTQEDEE